MLERPLDAALLPDGRFLWVRAGRHEAELIDTQTDGYVLERGTTTYGASMVWRMGEALPVVLDDVVMATFAEIDRSLLSTQHVRAALRSGLWHRVRARPPAEVRVRGFNTLRWSEDAHAWREVEPEPDHTLPYGVLAWSEDGSALVMRTARREGGLCFGRSEPARTQLLFTHIDR